VTFSSTKGTVYYKLQKEPKDFDEVVSMSVEGQNISSIARVKNISQNTVSDWILKASIRAEEYQNKYLKNYEIKELQFDEIKTFSQSKKNEKWIFTSMEVSSRLWLETEVGRRNYNSTEVLINNTINKGKIMVVLA
jgi:predicted DNA-binding protein YlxM (UPF0122 family)